MNDGARQNAGTGKFTMSTAGWPPERWAAVLVIGALGLLIMIRMGFRGVNVMGFRAEVG